MTRPIVVFPDAVFVAVEYLRSKMPGTMVYSQVPNPLPGEFIRIERLGGARRTLITDRPRIDIHCWSDSEENAEALTATARAYALAMGGRRGQTTVYDVREVGGPQWIPDAVSGKARLGFAIEFCTRGTEME